MANNQEQHWQKQKQFERNFIHFPFLGFAVVILLLNIVYPDINIMMALFGLFFIYNGALLFVSFIRHFKRTMILTLILTIMAGSIFGLLMYLYAATNNLLG